VHVAEDADKSSTLSGIAGSHGVRFFSKREQELSQWCGSNTWNGDGLKANPTVLGHYGFIGEQGPVTGTTLARRDEVRRIAANVAKLPSCFAKLNGGTVVTEAALLGVPPWKSAN
jgi:hypothetical protein